MTLPVYDSAQPRRPLSTELGNLWTHRGLVGLLVRRELTVRYKRSVLGVWWTLLNPLLTTAVMYLVFGQIFGRGRLGDTGDLDPFLIYLLSGVLFMTFFAQGVIATGASITGSASILTKVYVPTEVFAFAAAVAAAVNFLLSMIPLVVVQLATGHGIPWTVVLVPLPILAMLALVTGVGMIVAAIAVFFYDVLDLTRVIVQLIYYLTPTFYPITIFSDNLLRLVKANPMFSYVDIFRDFMYRGVFPRPWQWLMMFGTAIVFLVVGVWVFGRSRKQLVSTL